MSRLVTGPGRHTNSQTPVMMTRLGFHNGKCTPLGTLVSTGWWVDIFTCTIIANLRLSNTGDFHKVASFTELPFPTKANKFNYVKILHSTLNSLHASVKTYICLRNNVMVSFISRTSF